MSYNNIVKEFENKNAEHVKFDKVQNTLVAEIGTEVFYDNLPEGLNREHVEQTFTALDTFFAGAAAATLNVAKDAFVKDKEVQAATASWKFGDNTWELGVKRVDSGTGPSGDYTNYLTLQPKLHMKGASKNAGELKKVANAYKEIGRELFSK